MSVCVLRTGITDRGAKKSSLINSYLVSWRLTNLCFFCCDKPCAGLFVDTIVMNPPFGTRKKGSDMEFLCMALKVWTDFISQSCSRIINFLIKLNCFQVASGAVYSLHKTATRDVSCLCYNFSRLHCQTFDSTFSYVWLIWHFIYRNIFIYSLLISVYSNVLLVWYFIYTLTYSYCSHIAHILMHTCAHPCAGAW